ncbi:MAG: DUF2093 domain-containing protein [Parvibaculales bacterium]
MDLQNIKLGAVAEIRYLDGDFEIMRPGTHVICAITGKPILLEMLRYWNVERQEAYLDAQTSLIAHQNNQKA